MLFLHDVWVNWFEGEENGYNVCHFHEWRKEDSVELLDQVPLLKVQSPLFDYIENDLSELPKTLLESVFEKSYIRKNHERRKLEYCFVVTDGITNHCCGYDWLFHSCEKKPIDPKAGAIGV